MSFSERLAFLITANGADAIRTFQQVGSAAEKDIGKADDRLAKFGTRATQVGAGMLAFAGVAGGALLSFAHASEDANRSQLLLDNTLANSPKLVGETAGQFNELAAAIQGKTAADGDQIVAAMAMLGTFRLTADEIKGVTPLVVDYARKFNVDLTTAAVQVGKALDGQVGALKRNGVSIDEAMFKTDRFGAVTSALREQVGGFAEQEGATFSGRLARMKNELGDVQEGLGVGVLSALESVMKPATNFSNWIANTSPKTQELVGKFAAIGTAGIGAVGGLSMIAGQLIKMRERFTEVDAAGGRSLTTMGKFAKGAGIAAGIAGIAVALYEVHKATTSLKVDVERLAQATDDELVEAFQMLNKLGWDGRDGFAMFEKVVESNIGTAIRMRDALRAEGEDVARLNVLIDEQIGKQQQAARDTEKGTEAVEENTEAVEEQVSILDAATAALDDYSDALDRTFGAQIDVREAHREVREAVADLTAAIKEGQAEDESAVQWKDRLAGSVDDVVESLADEIDAMAESGEIANTAASRHDALRMKLEGLKQKFPALAKEIDPFIYALESAADKSGPAGDKIARDFIAGIVNGFRNKRGELVASADTIARTIEDTVRDVLETKSPSKVGERIGEDFDAGIAAGLTKGASGLKEAADSVARYLEEAAWRGAEVTRVEEASILDSLANIRSAQEALNEARKEAKTPADELRRLELDLAAAQEQYNDTANTARSNTEALTEAHEALNEALNDSLSGIRAITGRADAQRDLEDAEKDLADLRHRERVLPGLIVRAEQAVKDARAEGEDGARDLERAEDELADLREERRGITRAITEAEDELAVAQARAVDAQQRLFESGEALIGQGPEAQDFFRQMAEAAGLSKDEVEKLIDRLNELRDLAANDSTRTGSRSGSSGGSSNRGGSDVKDQLRNIGKFVGEDWSAEKVDRIAEQIRKGERTIDSVIGDVDRRINGVPSFHGGGEFRAKTRGGEGFAKLLDGEKVVPASGGGATVVHIKVPVLRPGDLIDGYAVLKALQKVQRESGPLVLKIA